MLISGAASPQHACGVRAPRPLYRKTSDVCLVQRHGRWSRPQTLEAYIRETASAQSLQPLPPDERRRILELSARCPALLTRSIASLADAEQKQWPREDSRGKQFEVA